MNGTRWSVRQPAGPVAPGTPEPARLGPAWRAAALSFVVVVAAAVWGPTPGDPTWWMVAELVLVAVLGLGGAVTAAWFAELARRRGRDLALVALFVAGFLGLQASLRLVGTLGRFYGWDG
ncbi:MAG TPA: hypothetical protein VFV40_01525 [Nocardioides sp.]|nr:hypothetical protein [Nocardioides sp.]